MGINTLNPKSQQKRAGLQHQRISRGENWFGLILLVKNVEVEGLESHDGVLFE